MSESSTQQNLLDTVGVESEAVQHADTVQNTVAVTPSDNANAMQASGFTRQVSSEQTSSVSLGQTLRAAREKRGLSIADVAQTIKFSLRQIESVEADNFSALSGNTFLRGMIRSYAKLLQLDVTPLLTQLEPYAPQVQSVVSVPPDTGMSMPLPGNMHRYLVYLKPLLAAVVLLASAGGYYYWGAHRAEVTAQPEAVSTHAPLAAGQATAVQPQVHVESIAATTGSATDGLNAASTASATSVITPVAPSPATRQLTLSFEGNSWVEIKDASKQVIFAQNNLPGSRQIVNGKPPFDIVIGNAPRVQLKFDERQVDLVPYTRVDVARLTLE